MRLVVNLRTNDFGQAHDLALRIRQLQRHEVFARNGFDHTDGHQRERTRQILGQIHNLAALHTGRRLDFVTRHHRPRIGRHDLYLNAKIAQFFLNQARIKFQRIVRHSFLIAIGRIEQRQFRQGFVRHFVEQRYLLFLLTALRLHHRRRWRLDMHRHGFLDALFFLRQFTFAHRNQGFADFLILFRVKIAEQFHHRQLQHRTDALKHRQPREIKKPAQARAKKHHQQQGRENLPQNRIQAFRDHLTEHATVIIGQRNRPANGVQIFQPHTAQQHHGKAQTKQQRIALFLLRFHQSRALLRRVQTQTQKTPHATIDHPAAQQNPPIRRQAKHIQQSGRYPRTQAADPVVNLFHIRTRVEKRRIARIKADQHTQQSQAQQGQNNPFGLAEQLLCALRKRRTF